MPFISVLMPLFNPVVLIFLFIFIFFLYRKVFPIIRNKYYTIKGYNDLQTLHRDIDCSYNPSIASLIIDNEIEVKDITADIMNLYAKKYLVVNKESNNLKITLNNNLNSFNELTKSDNYLVKTLIDKTDTFNFDEWKKLVNEEYDKLNYTEEHKKTKIRNYMLFVLSVIIIVTLSTFPSFENLFFSLIFGLAAGCMSIVACVFISVILDSKHIYKLKLNNNGKEQLKKWLKFKKFIKEYTFIKEKNIEDIVLYEQYIPYAVALGINKNYKDTIYSIFDDEDLSKILNYKIDYVHEFVKE